MKGRVSIDDLMVGWADHVQRVRPRAAARAVANGALLIDTRDATDIGRYGGVPGAAEIPLSVLPWRVDIDFEYRDRRITGLDQELVLMCMDGYSSLWAASLLGDLGFVAVSDVVGGFRAWMAQGLPVVPRPI